MHIAIMGAKIWSRVGFALPPLKKLFKYTSLEIISPDSSSHFEEVSEARTPHDLLCIYKKE